VALVRAPHLSDLFLCASAHLPNLRDIVCGLALHEDIAEEVFVRRISSALLPDRL
jgi:hypothetical protein